MRPFIHLWMIVVAVAGCATSTTPDGGAEVDSSFLLFEQVSGPDGPPARLTAYLKAAPRDGMLGLCGVVLADGPDNQVQNVWSMLADIGSHITWGEAAAFPALDPWPKVGTAFLPGHRANLVGQDLAAIRKPRAGCIKVDRPWKEEYATEPMRLRLTRTYPSPAPVYIFMPPPRRGK